LKKNESAKADSTDFKQGASKFEAFEKACIDSGSELALKMARENVAKGSVNEAASFVSLMDSKDQETFLSEMKGKKEWETVSVAICLFRSNRQKEAICLCQ
jgi:hypothetical protein